MRSVLVTFLVMVAACSGQTYDNSSDEPAGAAASTASPSPSVLNTEAGRYRIDRASDLDAATLPQNADLKMLDGDIARYAAKLCGLESSIEPHPTRCDLFVQPDRNGLLIGYALLKQNDRASIETAVETDRARSGLGCWISGDIENADFEHPDAKLNIGDNFEGRMSYAAWEKDPGNWMVAPVSDDADQEGSIGVWYVKRSEEKLRITQERWSYCYSDSHVNVDEVFRRAVALVREDGAS